MKKSILLLTTIVSLILAGCSSPASTPVDNSAELKDLQAQLKTLQAENESLKAQLNEISETTPE